MSATEIYKMITKLIQLTKADKILWNETLSTEFADYKEFEFCTEYSRGDRPTLTINKMEIKEYGIGIEKLLREIDRQYRRRKMYDYSDEKTTARKAQEERDKQVQKQRAEDLKITANNFLKSPGKNRGKKKRNW